jgi:hypothetical protein
VVFEAYSRDTRGSRFQIHPAPLPAPVPVANAEVERCLRDCLEADGFTLSRARTHGERGVDILARKGEDEYHIEVIGYKAAPPMRAKDFFGAFFQAVSRLDQGATHCVIAQASSAKVGMPERAGQKRTAWLRIAEAFPELELWFVDTADRTYERTTWRQWVDSTARFAPNHRL